MADETRRGESLSIWFLVGVTTLLYGMILLPFGAYEWLAGDKPPVLMDSLHSTLCWGLSLMAFGTVYARKYRPGQRNAIRARR